MIDCYGEESERSPKGFQRLSMMLTPKTDVSRPSEVLASQKRRHELAWLDEEC